MAICYAVLLFLSPSIDSKSSSYFNSLTKIHILCFSVSIGIYNRRNTLGNPYTLPNNRLGKFAYSIGKHLESSFFRINYYILHIVFSSPIPSLLCHVFYYRFTH